MPETPEILKLRILMCFHVSPKEDCTVMGISRTLKANKQRISRAMMTMEKEGLIDRSDIRTPKLTAKGKVEAERYYERINIAQNHLLYEGLDTETAKQDAAYWALYCSDALMDIIRSSDDRYRVKTELRDEKIFNGAALCKRLKDGCYQFPFIIYREHVKNNNNVSMANDGFKHPCTLYVNDGVGVVQLQPQSLSQKSVADGKMIHGKVNKLEYFEAGRFVSAEFHVNVIQFPASALNFVNMSSGGVGNVLHGSVCLKMQCSCGLIHMPESKAIFTILI